MISFTESALKAMSEQGDSVLVRISVTGGGCSGFLYDVKVEDQPREGDSIIEFEEYGVTVCVDKKSGFIVEETIVDYETGFAKSGFNFVNPKAAASCGCGKSFGM